MDGVDHPDAKGELDELKATPTGAEVSVTGRLPESTPKGARDKTRTLELCEWKATGR